MIEAVAVEQGPEEFIKRLGDPVWFQSLGTVLAFDWNASGLTTILTAALKEALRGREEKLGIFICGGKGRVSRRTPEEIQNWGQRLDLASDQTQALVYNSRMSAKVDSALVQDSYQIYHHAFFFTRSGAWTVVQQGMNIQSQTARRYHWHSANLKDLICEPHTGIISQGPRQLVLNLTARDSEETRQISAELIGQKFSSLWKDLAILDKHSSELSQMLRVKTPTNQLTLLNLAGQEFTHHPVEKENFSANRYLRKILAKLCSDQPKNYEGLLAAAGVGPKTMRALALVAEVIYGAKPSYCDPARYSFAHGGKDATPYPVDRPTYDKTIEVMRQAIR